METPFYFPVSSSPPATATATAAAAPIKRFCPSFNLLGEGGGTGEKEEGGKGKEKWVLRPLLERGATVVASPKTEGEERKGTWSGSKKKNSFRFFLSWPWKDFFWLSHCRSGLPWCSTGIVECTGFNVGFSNR